MNDTEEIWNPTRRLYEVLATAKKHGRTMEPSGHRQPIRKVLAGVLGVNPNRTFEIYRGLQCLSEALDWTETKIDESSIKQKEHYTRNLPAFRQALEIGNINDSWEVFERQLSDEAMADLLHAATRLSEIYAEGSLSKQELEELNNELQELINLFHEADIDSELRIVLLDLLATSSEILSEYRIRGGDALKKIVELALGRLFTKQESFKKADHAHIKKFLNWLSKLDKLYGKLGKYAPLLPNAAGMLLGDKTE